MDASRGNPLKKVCQVFLYSLLFVTPHVIADDAGQFRWWPFNSNPIFPGYLTLAECVADICHGLAPNCTCNQTSTNSTPSSISSIPSVSVYYLYTFPGLNSPPGSCGNSKEVGCSGGYIPFSGTCGLNKQWQPNGELQVETVGGPGFSSTCGVTINVSQTERPSCGGKPGSNQVGNPINCANGIKTQTEIDYRSSGPHPLTVERHYSNFQLNPDGSTSPYLAQSMRLQENEYAIRFRYNTSLKVAEISWPDGGHYAFDLANGVSGNSDRADKGYVQKVIDNNDYYDITGRRYRFNASGRLSSIREPDGYTRTLSYTTSTSFLISNISDSFGRTLSYSYSGTLISSIQIPGGGFIRYTYEFYTPAQRRLTSVIYPDNTPGTDTDNPRRLYHYENAALPEALTGITDENGVRFATWSYDSQGRAISSEHAGGAEKVTLDYTSNTETEVRFYRTASEFRESVYTHQLLNGQEVITEIETSPCTDCTVGTETRQYGSDGYLQSLTDENGRITQYLRNTRGLETSRTEAYGTPSARTITTTWHSTLDLPTLITETGRTVAFTYDANGNMLTRTETDTTVTPNVARTATYTYNSFGQVLTVNGPRTDVTDLTTYAYNSAGNLTSITNALSQQTQFTSYDAHGNPLTIIDPNNVTTILTYDPRQRLLSRTVAAGTALAATTRFEYYPAGQLKKIIQPDNSFLKYTYDNAHRLIKTEDNLGNYISYTLDLAGNRTEEKVYDPSDVLVKTQTSVFNNLSRLIETVGGSGQSTEYAYDAEGNLTRTTDPRNNDTKNTFDALHRLIKTVDTENGATNPTEYAYDARNNLTRIEDPKGLVTQYQYNGFDELIQQTSPNTGVTTYTYDAAGNRVTQTDGRGITTTYHYDALNRLTQITYPNPAENISYVYDQETYGIGRLRRITDPSGGTEYRYDAHGNIIETAHHILVGAQLHSYLMTYQYDTADRLTQLTYPSGRKVDYARDSAGRISAVNTSWHGHNTTLADSIEYSPFGPISQLTYGNGLVDSRTYDQDYRISEINIGALSFEYGYDPNGNIDFIENIPNTADSQLFDYDALNRLTEATGTYGLRDYGYDPVGNRLSEIDDTHTENYVYDLDSHQLAQRGTTQYQYDAAGNTTNNGQFTFLYNQANRLTLAQNGSITAGYYLYNGLGQRVLKIVGNTARLYFYDLNGQLLSEADLGRDTQVEYVYLDGRPLAQLVPRPDLSNSVLTHVLTDVQNPSESATVTVDTQSPTLTVQLSNGPGQAYSNPPDWSLINYADQRFIGVSDPQTSASTGYAMEYSLYLYADQVQAVLRLTPKDGSSERFFVQQGSADTTPLVRYYHTDHLGTPKALTDQAQQIVWWAEYEPFGKANITTELISNNLRLPGQYFDAETGLYYNYFRDYDPKTGRYIESDPIGLNGGINTFVYALNNPIQFIDPNGLCPMCLAIPGVCSAGGCEAMGLGMAMALRKITMPDGTEIEVDLPERIDPKDLICAIEAPEPLPPVPPDPQRACEIALSKRMSNCAKTGNSNVCIAIAFAKYTACRIARAVGSNAHD